MGQVIGGIIGGVADVVGAFTGAAQQSQDEKAASALNAQEGGLINNLTSGTAWLSPVLAAEAGGVNTLKSQVGGVANIGDLAKTLLGGNLTNAISAGLQNRNQALQSGIGDIADLSGRASAAAAAIGNPWQGLATGASALGGAFTPGTPGIGGPANTQAANSWGPGVGIGPGVPGNYTPSLPSGWDLPGG